MPVVAGWMLLSVNEALVAFARSEPLRFHWNVGLPVAAAVNVTVPPAAAAWLVGCALNVGAAAVAPATVIVKLKVFDASPVAPPNSNACSVKVYVPAVVGVPRS